MASGLLSVADALERVLADVATLEAETVRLEASFGRILATDVHARDFLPPFDNASMDGYAVSAADITAAPVTLDVVADIAAGAWPTVALARGQAARIMTGAPIPPGADAVVPVEQTNEAWQAAERPLPKTIEIRTTAEAGQYIRLKGDDVTPNAHILPSGHQIRAQDVSVMASLGVAEVAVVRQPKVGILATGDELLPVDQPLTPGKIRNSNGYAQAAQVQEAGGVPYALGIAGDTQQALRATLKRGLEAGVDLFISSAGVSVGAFDVVKDVLDSDGDVNFWRVNMRPGKPLAFGRYAGTPYFGLPGNPVSSMVSFERFARPALRKMGGFSRANWFRPKVQATLQRPIHSDGRESYLRGIVERAKDTSYSVGTTGDQGSHKITSLVRANCLFIIPAGVKFVDAGTVVDVLLL